MEDNYVSLDGFPFLTGHLKTLHQSASAPALSTLMSSANSPAMPSSSAAEQCRLMKRELLDKLDILSGALPPNTLDKLINDLGGTENVAEVKNKLGKTICGLYFSHFNNKLNRICSILLLAILL